MSDFINNNGFLIEKFGVITFNHDTTFDVEDGTVAIFFLNGKVLDILSQGESRLDRQTLPLVYAELPDGDAAECKCGFCIVSLDRKIDVEWQSADGTKGTSCVKVADAKTFVTELLKVTDFKKESVLEFIKEQIEKDTEDITAVLSACGLTADTEILEKAQVQEYEPVQETEPEVEPETEPEPESEAELEINAVQPTAKKKRNNSFLKTFSLAAVILGVAICIAVAVFLRPQDNKPVEENKPGTVISEGLPEVPDPNAEITFTDLANAKDGDFVLFGTYEQDADTSNGAEQLAWEVVAKQDGVLTLVSKSCIDCIPFNSTHVEIEWKECSLRKWLQGEFYDTAFTAAEKGKIVPSVNKNALDTNYNLENGNDTTDTVYLLSISEVKNLFPGAEAFRQAKPTAYAISKGVYFDEGYTNCCKWWLRSPGDEASKAAVVECDGYVGIFGDGVSNPLIAVRPVIKVSVK